MEFEHKESPEDVAKLPPWKQHIHTIIFGVDTFQGRLFDVTLLIAILLSVLTVILESVPSIREGREEYFFYVEWAFTAMFSVEFLARIVVSYKPRKYLFSFMGIIDFVAILPAYLSLFLTGSQALIIFRSVRLIRVFRILKLSRYIAGAENISEELKSNRYKITVLIGSVTCVVIIMGTVMYLIEGPEHGFTTIPQSIYWAIVTLTTVGYGDIAPETTLGKTLSSLIMLLGYTILAVPTGKAVGEVLSRPKDDTKPKVQKKEEVDKPCPRCFEPMHHQDANYCHKCGKLLPKKDTDRT